MQRGCMKNAALVLAQKTFSIQRKLNFNFTQKNFFYQNCVCEMVEPKFETEFWPMYWVSSGGWWLYSLVYPHRFSRSQEFFYNWLQVLNMLGFINKNKILAFFAAMAATQTLLYKACQRNYLFLKIQIWKTIVSHKFLGHNSCKILIMQTILTFQDTLEWKPYIDYD